MFAEGGEGRMARRRRDGRLGLLEKVVDEGATDRDSTLEGGSCSWVPARFSWC